MTLYSCDGDFYTRDRPEHPVLPEDRPRGGQPRMPLRHRSAWATAGFVIGFFLLIVVGVALFP